MAVGLATQPRLWTYDDYLGLRDDSRYEVIGGELLAMAPAPDTFHQEWLANLFLLLHSHAQRNQLGKVFLSPLDVILDEHNIVQPDILFVASNRIGIIQRRGVFGAPDLVVEIVSAFSVQRDRQEKNELYAQHGVREFWIVDPGSQGIEIFELRTSRYKLLSSASGKGKVRSTVLNLEFDVADVAPKDD
jgi:Uma2 family endonuclease